jgi:hypothetical protein
MNDFISGAQALKHLILIMIKTPKVDCGLFCAFALPQSYHIIQLQEDLPEVPRPPVL